MPVDYEALVVEMGELKRVEYMLQSQMEKFEELRQQAFSEGDEMDYLRQVSSAGAVLSDVSEKYLDASWKAIRLLIDAHGDALHEWSKGQEDALEIAKGMLAEANSKSARTRWERLDDVKQWVFDQRRANPTVSRAKVIKQLMPEVRERSRAAGEPLTGDDMAVFDTVERWFRKAGIA